MRACGVGGRGVGAARLVLLALTLAACGSATPSPSPTVPVAQHDAHTTAVMAALTEELGVAFESAGPHHALGRAPDGAELDLIGVPVEEVILSVPASEPRIGRPYLRHVRDLLHGPARVYDWVAAALDCRASGAAACGQRFEQGSVLAVFSDGGPDYVVVSIGRAR